MGYFDIQFAGGENDRNYLHCKYESNDAGNLRIFKLIFFPIQYLQIASVFLICEAHSMISYFRALILTSFHIIAAGLGKF